jgi:hypothetical protein
MTKTATAAHSNKSASATAAKSSAFKPQDDEAAKPNHIGHELFHGFKQLILAAVQHHHNKGIGASTPEISQWCNKHHQTLLQLSDEQFGLLNVQTMLNQLLLEVSEPQLPTLQPSNQQIKPFH